MRYDPATRRYYIDQDTALLIKDNSHLAKMVTQMDAMTRVCEAAQNVSEVERHYARAPTGMQGVAIYRSVDLLRKSLADLERARKGDG